MLFSTLEPAQPDPIMGLMEDFKREPNPKKINLSIGVYKNEANQTPILDCVREAEKRLLAQETTKGYLAIDGSPDYAAVVQTLLFGPDSDVVKSKRAMTAHTPGGTGGLRVGADFIRTMFPGRTLWISDPTWPNHPGVFKAAGLETKTYPWFDAASNSLAFGQLMSALERIPEGDVVLLHACCHNPTGVDPTPEQWTHLVDVIYTRKLLPFFDFAYQGFGDGLEQDAAGVNAFSRPGTEFLIASSYSKNFGLYNERVGAFTLVGENEASAKQAFGHVKRCIRSNYSNPPAHGGAIVTTILNDPALRKQWEHELTAMRDRINGMRKLFVKTLRAKGVKQDFAFIASQRGMFSFSGLTRDQVQALRDRYAIYAVGSGRINVAALTTSNMEAVCDAIAQVLAA